MYWCCRRRGTAEFKGAKDEGVCSIEAIHIMCGLLDPAGSYDDLLWYYEYIRQIVERKGIVSTRKKGVKRTAGEGESEPEPPGKLAASTPEQHK